MGNIENIIAMENAKEATGLTGQGAIRFFHHTDEENPIPVDRARALLLEGEMIEVPAAGAGSAYSIAQLLELGPLELYDSTSSAGDWTFRLKSNESMFLTQINRHPYYGFKYGIYRDDEAWQQMDNPKESANR